MLFEGLPIVTDKDISELIKHVQNGAIDEQLAAIKILIQYAVQNDKNYENVLQGGLFDIALQIHSKSEKKSPLYDVCGIVASIDKCMENQMIQMDQQIKEKDQEINSLRVQIGNSERKTSIDASSNLNQDGRNTELGKLKDLENQFNAKILAKDREINQQKSLLIQQQSNVTTLENQLQKLNAKIKRLESQSDPVDRLHNDEQEVNIDGNKSGSLIQQLKVYEQKIEELNHELDEKEDQLHDQKLQSQEAQAELQLSLDEMLAQLSDKEMILKDAARELTQVKEELEMAQNQLRRIHDETDNISGNSNQRIEDLEREVSRLRNVILTNDAKIREQEQHEKELERLRNENIQLDSKIKELNKIEEIRNNYKEKKYQQDDNEMYSDEDGLLLGAESITKSLSIQERIQRKAALIYGKDIGDQPVPTTSLIKQNDRRQESDFDQSQISKIPFPNSKSSNRLTPVDSQQQNEQLIQYRNQIKIKNLEIQRLREENKDYLNALKKMERGINYSIQGEYDQDNEINRLKIHAEQLKEELKKEKLRTDEEFSVRKASIISTAGEVVNEKERIYEERLMLIEKQKQSLERDLKYSREEKNHLEGKMRRIQEREIQREKDRDFEREQDYQELLAMEKEINILRGGQQQSVHGIRDKTYGSYRNGDSNQVIRLQKELKELKGKKYKLNQQEMKTNGNCYFDIPEILDIPYVHIILATAKYCDKDHEIQKVALRQLSSIITSGQCEDWRKALLSTSGVFADLASLLESKPSEYTIEVIFGIVDGILKANKEGVGQFLDPFVIKEFLSILGADIRMLKRIHVAPIARLTVHSTDEQRDDLVRQRALPVIIKILDHPDQHVCGDAIVALSNIILAGCRRISGTPRNHPYYSQFESLGGINRLVHFFNHTTNDNMRKSSALCLGRLFRNQKMPQQIAVPVIKYLKNVSALETDPQNVCVCLNTLTSLASTKENHEEISSNNFLNDLAHRISDASDSLGKSNSRNLMSMANAALILLVLLIQRGERSTRTAIQRVVLTKHVHALASQKDDLTVAEQA